MTANDKPKAGVAGQGGSTPGNDWLSLVVDAVRLPDAKLLQIYRLLEQVGDKPELNSAFAAMRPRLVTLRPQRRPTLSRLFFRPVEDLLDDPDNYSRRLSRISRSTLAPCWRALKERLPQPLQQQVQKELAQTDMRDGEAVATACDPLWQSGVEVLGTLLEECHDNLKLKVALFGRDDDVMRQLETIREILSIGPQVEWLKANLPERPIRTLAESHIDLIRKALMELGREDAQLVAPMARVLASRMQRPGELLRMLGDVKLGGTMQEKEALAREMSGYVVGDLLRQTAGFERVQPSKGEGGLDDMAAAAERLADGLNSVNEMVQSMRDKELSGRMQAARAEIGQFVLKNVCGDLDKTLIGTLFAADGAVASDEQVKRAEQLALALRRSSKLAPQLGIQKEVSAKIGEVRRQVETQTSANLRHAPRDRDGVVVPAAQRQMFNSLRVMEILAGSDEAERLLRDWRRQIG